MRRLCVLTALMAGSPAQAASPLLPFDSWHGETTAALATRSGTVEIGGSRATVAGSAYALNEDVGLNPSLNLRLAYEQQTLETDRMLSGVINYSAQQTLTSAAIAPHFRAGAAELSVIAGAISLRTTQTGRGGFGQGQRSGLGIGGGSRVPLGPHMDVVGEAEGYSLGKLQMISAGLRVSYRVWRADARAVAVKLEVRERQWSGPNVALDDGSVGMAVGYTF